MYRNSAPRNHLKYFGRSISGALKRFLFPMIDIFSNLSHYLLVVDVPSVKVLGTCAEYGHTVIPYIFSHEFEYECGLCMYKRSLDSC